MTLYSRSYRCHRSQILPLRGDRDVRGALLYNGGDDWHIGMSGIGLSTIHAGMGPLCTRRTGAGLGEASTSYRPQTAGR